MKKVILKSYRMKGDLDDNYTLFENGEVLHEYDRHKYKGGYNLTETLQASNLKPHIKQRLLQEANDDNKELVIKLLNLACISEG